MKTIDNKLEQNAEDNSKSVKLLFDRIKKSGQSVNLLDLVHQTGLSVYQVEDGLRVLMGQYPCRLEVSTKGDLVYYFKLSAEGYHKKSFVASILDFVGLLFRFCFKLWMVLMVYTFGIVYGGIISILLFGLSKSFTPILLFILGLFIGIKELVMGTINFFRYRDRSKSFHFTSRNILNIPFTYVFGCSEEIDELALEKKILAYLSVNDYKITSTELAMLTGWTLEKAQEEITTLMVRYQGEPYVTDHAIVIYKFLEEEVSLSAEKAEEKSEFKKLNAPFIWANLPPYATWVPIRFKESQSILVVIVGIAFLVSLVLSVFAIPEFPSFWTTSLSYLDPLNSFWISYFQFAFCVLFFLLPMLGKLRLNGQNRKIEEFRLRVSWLHQVFANLPDILHKDLYKEKKHKEELDQFRLDYRGNPANDSQGNVIYNFAYVQSELMAVSKERENTVFEGIDGVKKNSHLSSPSGSILGRIFKISLFLAIILAGGYALQEVIGKRVKPPYYEEWAVMTKHPEDVKIVDFSDWYDTREHLQERVDIFPNLEELTLDLYGTNILPKVLSNLPKLRKLDIENWSGRNGSLLTELTNLEELYLRNSKYSPIQRADVFHIDKLEQLKVLHISGFDPGQLLSKVSDLKFLEEIDFRSSQYRKFPITLFVLPNLKFLAVGDENHYKYSTSGRNDGWPGFDPKVAFQNLEVLRISLRKIQGMEQFPLEIFDLPKLQELYIEGYYGQDKYAGILEGLAKMKNLKGLGLGSKIPSVVYEMTNLEKLDISGFSEPELPKELAQLQNLEELILKQRGKMVTFPIEFATLTKLTTLDMSNYYGDQFPGGLSNLKQLQHLKLGGTYIKKLPKSIGQLEHLEVLYLHGYFDDTIPEELGLLKKLKEVHLTRALKNVPSTKEKIENIFSKETKVYFDLEY
jgi:Leucine-rich repeat (LRR) protein